MQTKSISRISVNTLFVLLFIAVAICGYVSFRNTSRLIETTGWVSRTHQVLATLQSIVSRLAEAQVWQRGFLLTGRIENLTSYNSAADGIDELVAEVRVLTRENPVQQKYLDELEPLIVRRLDVMENTLMAVIMLGPEVAKDMVGTGQLNLRLRAIVNKMVEEEEQVLTKRSALASKDAKSAHMAIVGGQAVVLALLGLAVFTLKSERRLRDYAEETTRASRESLREKATLLDKVRDAVLVRDMNENILYWNHAAELLYGWSAEEVLGKRADQILYGNGIEKSEVPLREVLKNDSWVGELTQITRDGRAITVEHRRTLIRDSAGNPKSQLIINIDVTEKKQLEAQIFRSQRLESIGTLAGGIAHDLNNVLTPITMGSKLLKRSVKDENALQLIDTMHASAERGAAMVRQLLAFARGKQTTNTALSVGHLIHEMQSMLTHTLPHSVEMRIELEDSVWPIKGDSTEFLQVLVNLCVNARDAMPRGGVLAVAAQNLLLTENSPRGRQGLEPGKYVVLTVSDTGTGISLQIIDRIFDPFFTTKEQGQGTGLGLSISLGIIKSYGGTIDVESRSGEGTKFSIYLPADSTSVVAERSESDATVLRGRGETILITDDEPRVLDLTRATLESHGFQVLTANGGQEAVESMRINHRRITAVLVDMMMPKMDGIATIRELLKIDPQVKIIGTSGLNPCDRSGGNVDAVEAGAKVFLPKPFDDDMLLRALHQVMTGVK